MAIFSNFKILSVFSLIVIAISIALALHRFNETFNSRNQRLFGALDYLGFGVCVILVFVPSKIALWSGIALWIVSEIGNGFYGKSVRKRRDTQIQFTDRMSSLIKKDPKAERFLKRKFRENATGHWSSDLYNAIVDTIHHVDESKVAHNKKD